MEVKLNRKQDIEEIVFILSVSADFKRTRGENDGVVAGFNFESV